MPDPPDPGGHPALSDVDFSLYQALIERETGIFLAPVKKAFLVGRLERRVRELLLPSFRAYLDLCQRDVRERTRLIDTIATNETEFFRQPDQWRFLREEIFPSWRAQAQAGRRARRARIWSAACATGEEPWSLAMALLEAFPSGWDVRVLATDLSTRALDRAERGTYPPDRAAQIPPGLLQAYMLDASDEGGEGAFKAGPEIRALVEYARVNLVGGGWPRGPFDLVFCRNVLIYFEPDTRARVVDRLLDLLLPDGYLFLGHAEALGASGKRVRAVLPTVFAPRPPEP
jgi:chemotaxis protein methyltransferase CheR